MNGREVRDREVLCHRGHRDLVGRADLACCGLKCRAAARHEHQVKAGGSQLCCELRPMPSEPPSTRATGPYLARWVVLSVPIVCSPKAAGSA